jgi:hypothetical protein
MYLQMSKFYPKQDALGAGGSGSTKMDCNELMLRYVRASKLSNKNTTSIEHAAEKLSMALNGKGAFHRFKDTLHRVDDQWLQAWHQWRNKRLEAALDEWLKSVL